MFRRLRNETAGAVVQPDEESAIGGRDDVEIAVAIDVGSHDVALIDVITQRDLMRERARIGRARGRRKHRGSKRNAERDQDAPGGHERIIDRRYMDFV